MVMLVAQQPGARHIDGKTEDRHRDRLVEGDRHRVQQTADAFPADQQRDQRQDDRRGEGGEVAELAGAEDEARVLGVAARIAVGDSREQQRPGMGGHVQPVGHERERPEDAAADDLQQHHRPAQPYHPPGTPLVAGMASAQENVAVRGWTNRRVLGGHRRFGQIEQPVDLADRAVDTPPVAHVAPMQDEALDGGGEFLLSGYFCHNRNI